MTSYRHQPANGGQADDGSWLERLIFNHRLVILLVCIALTIGTAFQLPNLRFNANFQRMIPTGHPYIENYIKHRADVAGQSNLVAIAVTSKSGNILDDQYLQTLKQISDEVYLINGVDRPWMVSLWTPTMRWLGITEAGIDGGPVIDAGYDGSPAALSQLRFNIERSGEVGRIVAPDFQSSIVLVPLMDFDNETGAPLDYGRFSEQLEQVRAKYQGDGVDIHIVGFAKVVGDLIDGVARVLSFFLVSIIIVAALVYWYSRCVVSTANVLICSLVGVLWLMGCLPLLGLELDPYTVLVPFLVFAIGVSHGAQKMNGILQDIGRGCSPLLAARQTFRRLFLAGFIALVADAVGFAVLLIIDIGVIQQLALIASLGVAFLILTNLVLLPIMLSYVGVGRKAAQRSLQIEEQDLRSDHPHPLWSFFDLFTQRRWATVVLLASAGLGVVGVVGSHHLQVGDLDPGAPELRKDSRYNKDNAYITSHYSNSSDLFMVMIESPVGQCMNYQLLEKVGMLEWQLRQLPTVVATSSFASFTSLVTSQFTEGNPRWISLVPNQALLNSQVKYAPRSLVNQPCSLSLIRIYLTDHKALTLREISEAVEQFAAQNDSEQGRFTLAAGNAGIEAATNQVVNNARLTMLLLVYGAVVVICLIAFRSWRAVVCAVLPLMLTSLLAEALMTALGIGFKVATLPVIALGVGIGVDYALYLLSVLLAELRKGASLSRAYYLSLLSVGRVVLLSGMTLSVGVATWSFSPIKFQADMGILLSFMFLWNMLGALILLPALASFLFARTGTQATSEQHIVAEERVPVP
ncbi:MMPL family transporter [Pseudomonas sp. 13B_2.1_Bac1]|uniref:efflux RND transporter permease subunit n=1 Tax=Pseudomonas sp. 13B_2.1_Bac1 TaxID=2971624 RepID=UPI0021C91628|nr:MMPL family transporter [Pseudomonas sp. 13B_2.1_Bac1]MCU1785187.1 MMPL family transporter [Pseudomonas sp. 13B_2.1_Bac1]